MDVRIQTTIQVVLGVRQVWLQMGLGIGSIAFTFATRASFLLDLL